MIRLIILIVAILIGVSNTGLCEIYKWTNDDGSIGFTDDISKVPEKYRNQINIKADKEPIKKEATSEKDIFKILERRRFKHKQSRLKVEDLFSNGININARNDKGATSLHIASLYGYLEIVDFLISKGVDINAKTNNGSTPLMYASTMGHLKVVKLLISKGADINVTINFMGINSNALSNAYLLKHTKIVELLRSYGASEPAGMRELAEMSALSEAQARRPQTSREIEEIIMSLWTNVKDALMSGDIETAVSYFAYERQEIYRENFKLFKSQGVLKEIVLDMKEFRISEKIKPNSRSVECELLQEQNGKILSFPVQFVRDLDGEWRIYVF